MLVGYEWWSSMATILAVGANFVMRKSPPLKAHESLLTSITARAPAQPPMGLKVCRLIDDNTTLCALLMALLQPNVHYAWNDCGIQTG
jgi:hypothetical protein